MIVGLQLQADRLVPCQRHANGANRTRSVHANPCTLCWHAIHTYSHGICAELPHASRSELQAHVYQCTGCSLQAGAPVGTHMAGRLPQLQLPQLKLSRPRPRSRPRFRLTWTCVLSPELREDLTKLAAEVGALHAKPRSCPSAAFAQVNISLEKEKNRQRPSSSRSAAPGKFRVSTAGTS